MLKLNLNDYVWVKLTDTGIGELRRQYLDRVNAFPGFSAGIFVPPKPDADGYVKYQLHELMRTFGHMIDPTLRAPFQTNIMFEPSKDKEQDNVNHPQHYNRIPGWEVIDIISSTMSVQEFEGYLKGNILKYRLRAGKKNDAAEDIAKADFYEDLLIKCKSH